MAGGRVISRWRWALALLVLGGCVDEPVVDLGDVRVVDLATSTATEGWAVNYPKQRKVLFVGDRLWLFYSDGRDMLARTTRDGETLTPPFVVREEAVFGHRCAFAWDGAHLHAACCLANAGADVLYRRGVPSDDGLSIAWDEDEQIAFDVPDARSVLYPKVLVDASGRLTRASRRGATSKSVSRERPARALLARAPRPPTNRGPATLVRSPCSLAS